METNASDKFKQIINHMKSKIKSIPVSDYKIGIIFFYFLKLDGINKKVKYLVEIMKVMNFKEENLLYEPKYEIFYSKFFDIVINNLKEDYGKSKELALNINIEELNHLNENDKKVIFWYLELSILVENALLLLFCFLNYEKNETKLITTFTHLNYDLINNSDVLQKSHKMQISDKEFKKINKNKEINLIGFETLEIQYKMKRNSSDKKKRGNANKTANSFDKSKLVFHENSININTNTSNDKMKDTSIKLNPYLNNEQKNDNTQTKISDEKEKNEVKNRLISEEKIHKLKEKNTEDQPKQKELIKIIEISPEKEMQDKSLDEDSKNRTEKSNKGKIVNIEKFDFEKSLDNRLIQNEDGDIIFPETLSFEINSDNNINILLKKGLCGISVSSYFTAQKLKYIGIYANREDIIQNIKDLSFHKLQFNYIPSSNNYWKINKTLETICNLFSNEDNLVTQEDGFFVTENQILFYTSEEKNQGNEIMFNSNYLRQLDYDYALEKGSSYKANSNIGKEDDKIDYFVIKGLDFEKNWEYFFDSHFELTKLPNIFFPVRTMNDSIKNTGNIYPKSNKEEIKFSDYIDNLFKAFIETDVARINPTNSDIEPNIFFKPYINECPFHIYENEETKEWKCDIIEKNEFKVYKHSIILAEIKNFIPDKVLNIDDFTIINKIEVQKTLYFVLYKLIKKIDYYDKYVKYEYFTNSNEISKYNFQLFLICYNKPINQLNGYIKKCFDNLIKNNHIKHGFTFQIIYSVPAISCLNIFCLSEKIDVLTYQINKLNNRINLLENEKNKNNVSNNEKK